MLLVNTLNPSPFGEGPAKSLNLAAATSAGFAAKRHEHTRPLPEASGRETLTRRGGVGLGAKSAAQPRYTFVERGLPGFDHGVQCGLHFVTPDFA